MRSIARSLKLPDEPQMDFARESCFNAEIHTLFCEPLNLVKHNATRPDGRALW